MPKFYFHIKDGVRLVTHDVGRELKDVDEAHREGATLASEVRREITKPADLVKELHVEIEDENGKIVGRIKLDQESPSDSL